MGIEFAQPRRFAAGPVPTDVGYQAWTFDLGSEAIIGRVLVSQTVVASRVYIPASFTCSRIHFGVVVAATSLTYARLAIYDEAGTTQLGLSDSLTTPFASVGIKDGTLGTPVALAGGPGRFVYAAVLTDGGTPPQGACCHQLGGGTATMVNTGFSPARIGTQAGQAALPASLSLTAFNSPYWFALS